MLLIVITSGVFILEYNDVCGFLINWGGIARVEEFKTQFFTVNTFLCLRVCFGVFLVSSILFYKKLNKVLDYKISFVLWIKRKIEASWINFSKTEKQIILLLFFCLLVMRLLFLFNWEYYEDEAFSYQYLVSKGILTTLTYYPGPNNHVLYNLICSFLNYSSLSEIWVMRLPSVIVSGLIFYICIPLLKTKFDFRTSLIISLLTQFCFNFFLYSFQGRGYALEVLFVVLAFYGLYKNSKGRDENYIFLFIVSSVLGLYTIPIFVYPLISIVTFNLLLNRIDFKTLFYSCVVIGGGAVLCYFPIFIVSGVDSVVANDWVKSLGITHVLREFPHYINGLQDWLWDFPSYGIIFSLGLFILMLLRFGLKKWFWFAVLSFLIPFSLIILQGVLPFPRVWTYLTLLQGVCVGFLISQIKVKPLFIFLLLLFILTQLYSFYILL